jgi:hypothetical protein
MLCIIPLSVTLLGSGLMGFAVLEKADGGNSLRLPSTFPMVWVTVAGAGAGAGGLYCWWSWMKELLEKL